MLTQVTHFMFSYHNMNISFVIPSILPGSQIESVKYNRGSQIDCGTKIGSSSCIPSIKIDLWTCQIFAQATNGHGQESPTLEVKKIFYAFILHHMRKGELERDSIIKIWKIPTEFSLRINLLSKYRGKMLHKSYFQEFLIALIECNMDRMYYLHLIPNRLCY